MAVTLERCSGTAFVARAGDAHERHGDPYEMACTVECNGTEATAKGLVAYREVERRDLEELMKILRDMGIKTLCIEHSRDGRLVRNNWSIG